MVEKIPDGRFFCFVFPEMLSCCCFFTETYAAARAKLSRVEDTSDLQTDAEVPKKRKRL